MADGNSMTDGSATHGSVTQRRALAALILAESERNGAGIGTRLPTERQLAVDLGVSRAAVRHAMAVLQAGARSCAGLLSPGRPRPPFRIRPQPRREFRTPMPGWPSPATTRRPT
jgi:DNA-binding transcriptional MocR family regulator